MGCRSRNPSTEKWKRLWSITIGEIDAVQNPQNIKYYPL
jgi:hypothetical protein